MFTWINRFMACARQTKYLILTLFLYALTMIWTTVQVYARLEYSRTHVSAEIDSNQPEK